MINSNEDWLQFCHAPASPEVHGSETLIELQKTSESGTDISNIDPENKGFDVVSSGGIVNHMDADQIFKPHVEKQVGLACKDGKFSVAPISVLVSKYKEKKQIKITSFVGNK